MVIHLFLWLVVSGPIPAVHSLEKSTLGQYICSYALDSDEILMSLSFSPSSEYLLVGVRSSKIFGCFLKISKNRTQNRIGLGPPIWINSVDNNDNPDDLSTGLCSCAITKIQLRCTKTMQYYYFQAMIKSLC